MLQHIVSYWNFRFGPGAGLISGEELMDVLMDFEAGLAGRDDPAPEPMIDRVSLAA